jgi:hypothetical protein
VERLTGMPISEALADHLSRLDEARPGRA